MPWSLCSTISMMYAPPSSSPWSRRRMGSLPFLNTKLTQREDGTLNVNVFRKRTHTNRYLHLNSHHPVSATMSGVSSTGPGTSRYGRRTCGKNTTSPLHSNRTVIPYPYHSFMLSPLPCKDLPHQWRRSWTKKRIPKRRSSH